MQKMQFLFDDFLKRNLMYKELNSSQPKISHKDYNNNSRILQTVTYYSLGKL